MGPFSFYTMKKITLCVLFLCCLAQVQGQLKFGFVAGLHINNLNEPVSYGPESKISINFHGGIAAGLRLKETSFDIQGEVLYTTLGFKNSSIMATDQNGNDLGTIGLERINYIELPFYLLYNFRIPSMKLKVGAGPFFAFKVSQATRTYPGGETFRGTASPLGTSASSSTMAGGGICATIQLSPQFFLSGHYHHSFTEVYQRQTPGGENWKMNDLGISLGIFLK